MASVFLKKRYNLVPGIFLLLGTSSAWADFKVVKPGFEEGKIEVSSGIFTSELSLIRIDPKLWSISTYKSESPTTASEVARITDSAAAINANFFGKDLQALGLIVSSQKVRHGVQFGGRTLTGIFLKDINNDYRILFREKFQPSDQIIEAVQAGPRLISGGEPISIPEDISTRRSGIAIDQKGRLILFASKDRFPGLSLVDLQKILLQKELEIRDALNLDGGGSSQLYVKPLGKNEGINVSGGDKVPVFLIVKEIKR